MFRRSQDEKDERAASGPLANGACEKRNLYRPLACNKTKGDGTAGGAHKCALLSQYPASYWSL